MTLNAESSSDDQRWMHRALELARRGIGLTTPNPTVGCVIVRNGQIVGEGFHIYDCVDHAEVVALRHAGEFARGSTAYVTLEPCSHTGRTGPCADALVAAGVDRVVIATQDPNPLVAGDGAARLRASGVHVEVGLLQDQARELNDAFAKFIVTGTPFVTLKIAMSQDGMIAPAPANRVLGKPFWITGKLARAEVQRMRHAADAVLTGINTVIADDPRLTDRTGLPRRHPLLRVVLDSQLRIPLQSELVWNAKDDLLVFTASDNAERIHALEERRVRVERVTPAGDRLSLPAITSRLLNEPQLTSILIEAGAQINSAVLRAGLVDKVVIFRSIAVLGDGATPAFLDGIPDWTPLRQRTQTFGDDVATTFYLKDPWIQASAQSAA